MQGNRSVDSRWGVLIAVGVAVPLVAALIGITPWLWDRAFNTQGAAPQPNAATTPAPAPAPGPAPGPIQRPTPIQGPNPVPTPAPTPGPAPVRDPALTPVSPPAERAVVPLTVADLIRLERPPGARGPKVSLRLIPDRPDLVAGETWAVAVEADRDGYVMLLAEEHDPGAKREHVDLLLPNALTGLSDRAMRVKAGEPAYLPAEDPNGGEFTFNVDDRKTRVTLRAVFTTFPVRLAREDLAGLPDVDDAAAFLDLTAAGALRLVDPTAAGGGRAFPNDPVFGDSRSAEWAVATLEMTTNWYSRPTGATPAVLGGAPKPPPAAGRAPPGSNKKESR